MAATYNDPNRGGQPEGPSTEGVEKAARRVADQLLLATCAASDHATAALTEKRLREAALRFVLAGPGGATAAAHEGVATLLAESGADGAVVAVMDLPPGSVAKILVAGETWGVDLVLPACEALLAPLSSALRGGRALEHPSGDRDALPAAAVAAIEAAGVRSLRWSLRPLDDGRVLVVALHSGREARYWTPQRRQFQDGIAEILAAALPWL
jgi:GAF domain-containing protein